MKSRVLMSIFLGMLLMPALCSAGELMEDVDTGATLDVVSAYIWRAQNLVDEPVFQSSGYVDYKGFRFDFWSNWDFTDQDEFTEIDYTWSYSADLGIITPQQEDDIFDKVNVTGGYTFYTFPNLDSGDMTHEFFAGVALDAVLSPSYTAYWDVDEGDGWYHEWGIGHTFDFDPISIDMGLTIGLNVDQWGYDTSLTALDFSTAVAIPLKSLFDIEPFKYFTVTPHVNYSMPLDSQYDHEIYGGVSIALDI